MNRIPEHQARPSRTRPLAIALVVLAVLAAAGCATPRYTDYSAFINEPRPLVTSSEYRLAPPDTIMIHSRLVSEIDGHQQTIRPDGRISLPLLGSMFVAGKTTEEVSEELAKLAGEYYQDAQITVRVVHFASKRIYVFGEVAGPGPYPYNGTNTVLDTLARAQPTRLANPSRIQVLRPNADGELTKRMTVSLDDMVKTGDTGLDAVLEEGDIIYVPPNGLASVGLALQQLLLPIQPAAATVRGPAEIGTDMQRRPYNP